MKIGIDVTQIQYQGSGVATYTLELVKHLIKQFPEHEFVFYGASLRQLGLLRQLLEAFDVKKILLPAPNSLQDFVFNRWGGLPIEVFVGQVDIFHASDWTMPKAQHAQLVTTIHDLTVLKYPQYQHPKIIATHTARLKRVQQLHPAIIADSQATKNDLIKMLQTDPNSIKVIHLAASPDFNQFANLDRHSRAEKIQRTKAKYNLSNYLLYVGTSEPRKNLARTIESFKQLKANYHDLELVLVGKYGWGEKLNAPGVRKLGFVEQTDLPAIYAGAQTFVYPSIYEGFGLPVLEAMTVGTPVVTSKRGSLAEVAGPGAIVVNPTDVTEITQGIVASINYRAKWRELGLKQAKKFSWSKTATQTMGLYEELLKN